MTYCQMFSHNAQLVLDAVHSYSMRVYQQLIKIKIMVINIDQTEKIEF